MRPNVLLIVFDTARADAFSPYGAPADATPTFADLAGRGGLAEQARATACWTVPSHASIFTGLLPRAAGLAKAPGGRPDGCRGPLEARRHRLLPAVLRRHGYATTAVSTNLWITPRSGFGTGFDEFVAVDTQRQSDLSRTGVRSRLRWLAEGVRARVDDGADEAGRALAARAPGWAEAERPFFCFVNLVEAHSPYLPPRPYSDLGPLGRALAAVEARRHLTMDAIWRACAGGFDVPEAALERMRALYAGAIRRLDGWLASLLESLDRGGVLERTLVIVTSDHGENFGEGGLMGHAFSLDERLLRVPLAVAGPGWEHVARLHSLVGLPAAIAAAIGLEEHPWVGGHADGSVAVAELQTPVGPDDPRLGPSLARWGLGEAAAARITTPMVAAAEGSYKLLLRGEREELYDLRADPLEASPVAADALPPEALSRLREAAASAPDAEPGAAEAASGGVEPAPEPEQDAEELSKLEERMRLLGYM